MDKNIQEALKWIYASLGGDISDLAAVDDITVILNAIAELDTVKKISGATELPTVTADDNGDVLTVVNGAWDKAEASSDVLLLHINTETGALDKTWQEIHDAIAAGKRACAMVPLDPELGEEVVMNFLSTLSFEGVFTVIGYIPTERNDYIVLRAFVFDAASANDFPVTQMGG